MSSSDLGQFVKTTTEIKYSSLAAATFFFWDYCITFGDEVELMWKCRTASRYATPKGLLIALYILFFAIHGAAVVFMMILLSQWVLKPIPSSIPSKFRNVPCFVVKAPKVFPYYWWIHKYFAMGMGGGGGLLQVLVRDGAWAFFMVFDSMGGVGIMALLWLHTFLGVVYIDPMCGNVHVYEFLGMTQLYTKNLKMELTHIRKVGRSIIYKIKRGEDIIFSNPF
ncbi:hypothetical protein BU17DRAFT_62998 [Hysterangium stoloniferum]|nr:hypothetical protein BU17DRAFT_62998 [Hysterangium stoloniferum]